MSNKMASKAKKQAEPDQNTPEAAEAAGLDAAQQTIKTLMKLGKERGFVNAVLDHMAREARPEDFA